MPPLSKDLFPKLNVPEKIYGYEVRNPQESELQYFYDNQNISGMAAEDNRIILNPYSDLDSNQMNSVAQNEAIRLYLRNNKIEPTFNLTEEQAKQFKNYSANPTDTKHTILGRILTNDTSVGKITPEQRKYADWLQKQLSGLK